MSFEFARLSVRALVANRLAHFAAIGALVFALAPRSGARRVELRSTTLAALRDEDAQRSGGPLAPARAGAIEDRAIEDELLYREALRMSLDKDDPIVRRRLIEKLLFLVEDMGGASRAPTDAELRAYFDATPSARRAGERVHFVHVFASTLNALPRSEDLDPEARVAPPVGEAFPYSRDVTASRVDIVRRYGEAVADRLDAPDPGWSAPVASPFGFHRVHVVERLGGESARFEDVKKEIELDYMIAKRERVVGQYLSQLASRYDIRVDGRPVRGFVPPPRVALRADPSAED